MKILQITAMFFAACGSLLAGEVPSVSLQKALATLERAHAKHIVAMQTCGFKIEHEIGWDYMESGIRELASAKRNPKIHEMIEVVRSLRVAHNALFKDVAGCFDHIKLEESIHDVGLSLDEAAIEVENRIVDRSLALESSAEYYKNHSCPK